MPETAIDENGDSAFGKIEVGSPEEVSGIKFPA
jgi:hypothetical protein